MYKTDKTEMDNISKMKGQKMEYRDGVQSKPIPGFENYSINSDGFVTNMSTGRIMILSPNGHGDLMVGLMRHGIQYKRSVKLLVAEAFVDGKTELMDTPIQLNHEKTDLCADNICWRPRWFAWTYYRQFEDPKEYYFYGPVLEIHSELEFHNILHAAQTMGLLCGDILSSIHNNRLVWPTASQFAYLL